jgi:hypothetical protein
MKRARRSSPPPPAATEPKGPFWFWCPKCGDRVQFQGRPHFGDPTCANCRFGRGEVVTMELEAIEK